MRMKNLYYRLRDVFVRVWPWLAVGMMLYVSPAAVASVVDRASEQATSENTQPRSGPVVRPLAPGQLPPGVKPPSETEEADAEPKDPRYPDRFPLATLHRSLENAWSAASPTMRVAMMAEVPRRGVPTRDCVLIVPDTASYIAALSAWTPDEVFPVLIDDGTPEASARIARFNRAFIPKQVFRWQTPGGENLEPDDVSIASVSAFTSVWGLPLETETFEQAADAADARVGPHRVVGVVLMDPADPAWAGGLALSLARYQPMLPMAAPGKPNNQLTYNETTAFVDMLASTLGRTGLDWREIGDDVDMVTIAMNMPVRCSAPDNTARATTDRVGRHDDDMGADSTRWAWAGQVLGNESESAYMAMCSLFIQPERAWFYDTYPDEQPWSAYDATTAASRLSQSPHKKMEFIVDDPERPTRANWLGRASEALDAGVIVVNSKGLVRNFEILNEQAAVGDLPILTVPAFSYFVHSFAGQQPASRDTVAGRLLDRGVYAMVVSVDEPGLSGFLPTPRFTQELGRALPLGIASRYPTAQCWKIAVIGDPMLALGAWRSRIDGAPPALFEPTDLDSELRDALQARDLASAVELLAVMGRDEDAVRLARSASAEGSDANSPQMAMAAAMPLFRAGFTDDFLSAVRALPDAQRTIEQRDAVWLAGRRELMRGDSDWLGAMRENIRKTQYVADGKDLAAEYAKFNGRAAARELLIQLRDAAERPHQRRALDREAQSYGR